MEPTTCVPSPALKKPAATPAAEPLEEPPGAMRLLLTSADPERLLATVRSRCQRLRLALPPQADALAWLQAQGLDDAAALLAASSPLLEVLVLLPELATEAARLPEVATGTPTDGPAEEMLLELRTAWASTKMAPPERIPASPASTTPAGVISAVDPGVGAVRGPSPSGSEVSVWIPLPLMLGGSV